MASPPKLARWGGGVGIAPYLDSHGRKKTNSTTTNIRHSTEERGEGGQPASVITHCKCFGVVLLRKEKECAKNQSPCDCVESWALSPLLLGMPAI